MPRRTPPALAAPIEVMMRCSIAGALGLLCCTGGAARAQAAPRVLYPSPLVEVFAELTYERAPGAQVCPDEDRFRLEVGAQMGVDSFEANPEGIAVGRVHVIVTGSPDGFVAGYEWTGFEHHWRPTGRYTGSGTTYLECLEVLRHVVTGLAMGFKFLEVELAEKYAPKPAPPPPPVKCADPAKCEDLAEVAVRLVPPPSWPTPEPKDGLSFRLGLGAWAGQVTMDRPAVGMTLDAGIRYKLFSLGGEVHWDPSLGKTPVYPDITLDYTWITGALLPCLHLHLFAGCLKGEWGAFLFNGTQPPRPPKSYRAVGIRMGLEYPVAPWFAIRVAGELLGAINPAVIMHQETSIFQVAKANAELGIGALFVLEKP